MNIPKWTWHAAATSIAVAAPAASAAPPEAREHYADPANPALPDMDMEITPDRTALVVIDPQVDLLDPGGVAWGVVGESVSE